MRHDQEIFFMCHNSDIYKAHKKDSNFFNDIQIESKKFSIVHHTYRMQFSTWKRTYNSHNNVFICLPYWTYLSRKISSRTKSFTNIMIHARCQLEASKIFRNRQRLTMTWINFNFQNDNVQLTNERQIRHVAAQILLALHSQKTARSKIREKFANFYTDL